ncbi:MAG: hypothetical protein AAFR59_19760, partial [Bacteroidota bacterium]
SRHMYRLFVVNDNKNYATSIGTKFDSLAAEIVLSSLLVDRPPMVDAQDSSCLRLSHLIHDPKKEALDNASLHKYFC